MSEVTIAEEPVGSEDVQECFRQYAEELGRVFGYSVETALPLGLDDLTPPRGLVLIAREQGEAVGCGALRLQGPAVAEIKRMWVAPSVRGRDIGGRLLEALEARVLRSGRSVARLDTNDRLAAAMRLYRAHGYTDTEPFNDEPFATHWLAKSLGGKRRR